jgi:hypothetical protein
MLQLPNSRLQLPAENHVSATFSSYFKKLDHLSPHTADAHGQIAPTIQHARIAQTCHDVCMRR